MWYRGLLLEDGPWIPESHASFPPGWRVFGGESNVGVGLGEVRSRIPEPLWASAVEVAVAYGIHWAAKALRLSYYALKKRVAEGTIAVYSVMGREYQDDLCGVGFSRSDRLW